MSEQGVPAPPGSTRLRWGGWSVAMHGLVSPVKISYGDEPPVEKGKGGLRGEEECMCMSGSEGERVVCVRLAGV